MYCVFNEVHQGVLNSETLREIIMKISAADCKTACPAPLTLPPSPKAAAAVCSGNFRAVWGKFGASYETFRAENLRHLLSPPFRADLFMIFIRADKSLQGAP